MNTIQTLITDHNDIWTAADTAKKSGRGRSSGNAASVYGIKKLRELILELAVRGKLVPQDANDEPASELLKRMQVKKAKLITEGKIKKTKSLPLITEEEKPFDLPQGWSWVRLGDTGKIFNGNSINENEKLEKYTNLKNGFPFIATKDVGYGRDELDYQNGILVPFENEIFKIAHKGAVLICSEGGSAGKKIGMSYMDICFGNKLYANEVWTGLVPRYIFYVYQSPNFFKCFRERMTGIIGGISINAFLGIVIPIPSEREQIRIVAKVDELMALCDQLETGHGNAAEAHEKLVSHLIGTLTKSQPTEDFSANWERIAVHFDTMFTTEASIDVLKQSLLQLAVMGKLVPQDPKDKPASELLKRIQAEKAKLIADGKIKKDKPLADIAEEEKPFNLPQGWGWVRLQNLLDSSREISYGVIKLGNEPKLGGIYTLRCSDVKPGFIDLSGVRRVSEEIEKNYVRTRLTGGEILLNIRGTLGGVALVEPNLKGYNVAREVAVIPISVHLSSVCLVNVMRSNYFWNAILDELRGIAYKGLNLGALRLFPIPLPPLSEQHRIVAKVDELMAICDQLKSRLTEAKQLEQKLADVLVDQAIS